MHPPGQKALQFFDHALPSCQVSCCFLPVKTVIVVVVEIKWYFFLCPMTVWVSGTWAFPVSTVWAGIGAMRRRPSFLPCRDLPPTCSSLTVCMVRHVYQGIAYLKLVCTPPALQLRVLWRIVLYQGLESLPCLESTICTLNNPCAPAYARGQNDVLT